MKNFIIPSWGVFVALLMTLNSPCSGAVAEVQFPDHLTYSHAKGDCSPEVLSLVPLTLLFSTTQTTHQLVGIKSENATLSGVPRDFGKEGLADERAFMLIETETDKVMIETESGESDPILQLWTEKDKAKPFQPWISAFYANNNKTCLIMNDPKAAENPLAIPRF